MIFSIESMNLFAHAGAMMVPIAVLGSSSGPACIMAGRPSLCCMFVYGNEMSSKMS